MKIWIIHQHAALPNQPGITRHFSLAKGLVAQGHQVVIFTSGRDRFDPARGPGQDGENTLQVGGVTFRLVPTGGYQGNGVKRVLDMLAFALKCLGPKAVAELDHPDVVIGCSPHPLSAWAGSRLAKRYRCPFIYEVRDLWPETLVAFGIPSWHPVVKVFGAMERRLARAASAIISPLQGAGAYFARYGIKPENVLWVPNGIDPSLVPAMAKVESSREFEIVYAGALGEANALDKVLEAAAELKAKPETSHVRFRLIGSGAQEERLRRMATEWGLNNVTFAGPVPKDQIYQHLRRASALVVMLRESPLYRWGISINKVFDYMAVGRPILFGGTTPYDLVAQSGAGISFSPGTGPGLAEAVTRMLGLSPEEREAMGLRGRAVVLEQYNLDDHARNLASCLGGINQRHGGVGALQGAHR